jgi:hypothetical protein
VKSGGRGAYLSSPWADFKEARTKQAISNLGHARYPPATRTLDRFAKLDIDGAGRWSGDDKGQLDVTHGAHPFASPNSLLNLAESWSQRGKVLANMPVLGLDDTGDEVGRFAGSLLQDTLTTNSSSPTRTFFILLQLCLFLAALL